MGLVVAPRGRLLVVLAFTFADGKIIAIDVVTDPQRLRALDLAVLKDLMRARYLARVSGRLWKTDK